MAKGFYQNFGIIFFLAQISNGPHHSDRFSSLFGGFQDNKFWKSDSKSLTVKQEIYMNFQNMQDIKYTCMQIKYGKIKIVFSSKAVQMWHLLNFNIYQFWDTI